MFSEGFTLRYKILIIGLIITVICLIIHPPVNIQLILFFAILLITGIPHGSLDFYLEDQRYIDQKKKISLLLFIVKYLTYMLIYAALWFVLPKTSLLIFIFIAAYHFGEIDWFRKNDSGLNAVMQFIYGLFLIVFLITIHIRDTAPIIAILLKNSLADQQIITIGTSLTLYCEIGFCILSIMIFILRKSLNWTLPDLFSFLIQTLLLYGITSLVPFYLSFMFYFGIWHSVLSFDIIRKQLKFANNIAGWKQMGLKCMPFVVVAVLALCLFAFSSQRLFFSGRVITNLIIGLAVLTLPHLQVFSNAIKSVSASNKDK